MSPSQELHPKYVFLCAKTNQGTYNACMPSKKRKIALFLADSGNRANVTEKNSQTLADKGNGDVI